MDRSVEDTLARLRRFASVEKYLIVDAQGTVLRSSKSLPAGEAAVIAAEMLALTSTARRAMRDLNPKVRARSQACARGVFPPVACCLHSLLSTADGPDRVSAARARARDHCRAGPGRRLPRHRCAALGARAGGGERRAGHGGGRHALRVAAGRGSGGQQRRGGAQATGWKRTTFNFCGVHTQRERGRDGERSA